MKPRSAVKRKTLDYGLKICSTASACFGLGILGWILLEVIIRGVPALGWTFFTQPPTPPGIKGGGIVNALAGTAVMLGLAICIAVPLGLFAGLYLSEYGRMSRMAEGIRFLVDVFIGIPSLLIGLCVFLLVVAPLGHFSGYAGVLALIVLLVPLITKMTDERLRMISDSLREAAVSLNTPRWKIAVTILFRSSQNGLIKGILLAIVKISGVTAPLLFTALNSPFILQSLSKPTGNLPVTLFHYAMSPYPDRNHIAWGIALIMMSVILLSNLIAAVWLRE